MSIKKTKIGDSKKEGQYVFLEQGDFEYVNPVQQIMNMHIATMISFERDMLIYNGFDTSGYIFENLLFERALNHWEDQLKRYRSIKLPDSLIELLTTDKKKKQVNLLKGLSLTSDELIAFIFKAYEAYGYKFSQYKASHHHEGIDIEELPEVIHIDEDAKVHTIGETTLTEGQQKQVIEHRKVTVCKFLDKGDIWHCFFLTFKSLGGKEQYKNGQPHLHYISNAWNLPRQEVKEQLTNKTYSLPSLPHIDFHTHRNPRND